MASRDVFVEFPKLSPTPQVLGGASRKSSGESRKLPGKLAGGRPGGDPIGYDSDTGSVVSVDTSSALKMVSVADLQALRGRIGAPRGVSGRANGGRRKGKKKKRRNSGGRSLVRRNAFTRLIPSRESNTIAITLYAVWNVGTTASTDYNTALALVPANFTEWAALSSMYDECIVDGGFYQFANSFSVGTAAGAPFVLNAVAFDPLAAAPLTSILGVYQHKQRMVWATPSPINAFNFPMVPTPTKYPLSTFKWVTLRGQARSATAITLFGHEWSNTSDAGDAYGYIKPYYTSAGTASVQNIAGVIGLNMRFRSRT